MKGVGFGVPFFRRCNYLLEEFEKLELLPSTPHGVHEHGLLVESVPCLLAPDGDNPNEYNTRLSAFLLVFNLENQTQKKKTLCCFGHPQHLHVTDKSPTNHPTCHQRSPSTHPQVNNRSSHLQKKTHLQLIIYSFGLSNLSHWQWHDFSRCSTSTWTIQCLQRS